MPAARVAHYSPQEPDTRASSSVPGIPDVSYAEEEKTAFEKILNNLHNDPKWMKEISLGRRVGFYRFRGDLGQGNFSTVKLAHHQLTKDKVAVKVIDKVKLDHKTQKMLSREMSNMDILAHPNIIRLFEVVETMSRIYLVLEFAPGGELFNRVTTEGRLIEPEAATLFSQVVSAVAYLHSIAIIHRDIKAENVFLSTRRKVKLGDFGFSTKVSRLKDQLSTFCGSPPYAAPELYKDESYEGPAVDVWALGVLLYFLLTADMPFKASTVASLKRQILVGSFLIPSYVSNEARELINQLMSQNPAERLRPDRIVFHEWFLDKETSDLASLPNFVTFPRSLNSSDPSTDIEDEAYDCLEKWGVGRDAIVQASDLGAKSSLVATYRILIHRLLQLQDNDDEFSNISLTTSTTPVKVEDGGSGLTTPEPKSLKGSRTSSSRKFKFSFRNGLRRNSHSVKSTTCEIL